MVNQLRRLQKRRNRRRYRVRNSVRKNSTRACRLSVFRSGRNIYAQLINDEEGRTICAANSLQKGVVDGVGGNKAAAKQVGLAIGRIAQENGITEATFDRGIHSFHGRVAALAEGAREAGLKL